MGGPLKGPLPGMPVVLFFTVLLQLSATVVGAEDADVGASDESCPASQMAAGGMGCGARAAGGGGQALNASQCRELGFDPLRLQCSTCALIDSSMTQAGIDGGELSSNCHSCCRRSKQVERFDKGRLIADARLQERDQDLHDFIKRKASLFPNLEVEYQEGAMPAVELENDGVSERVVRADVQSWKSHDVYRFLEEHLKPAEAGQGAADSAQSRWTAEIQTCSG